MVRTSMNRARGWVLVVGRRLTRSDPIPKRDSSTEAVSPIGPPPMIRTGTCTTPRPAQWATGQVATGIAVMALNHTLFIGVGGPLSAMSGSWV